jgi:hypothetical protein
MLVQAVMLKHVLHAAIVVFCHGSTLYMIHRLATAKLL